MAKMSIVAYLLRPHIKDYAQALQPTAKKGVRNQPLSAGIEGFVYWKSEARPPPDWAEFLEQGLREPLGLQKGVSNSAVLFVKAQGRILAFTFGYGRFMLDETAYELDFGLRVALNTVDPERLRSIESKTFDENVLSTLKQSGREAPLDLFGLVTNRELVAAIGGRPRDPKFADLVAGKDALAYRGELTLKSLPTKCVRFLEAYAADDYKDRFGWIDQFRRVRDETVQAMLDAELVTLLRSGNPSRVLVCPPDVVDAVGAQRFRFQLGRQKIEPLFVPTIVDYLRVQARPALTLEALHSHRLDLLEDGATEPTRSWSVYRCINFELSREGSLFILHGGLWYQVEESLVVAIDAVLDGLPKGGYALPDADVNDTEPDYNVAAKEHHNFALMDRRTAKCLGARTAVEVCDLMAPTGHLIHVKDSGASSKMSHLFTQVEVASLALLNEEGFRREFRRHLAEEGTLREDAIPLHRPDPKDHPVVFGIMARPMNDWPNALPFLTKFGLAGCVQRLRTFGFPLHVVQIVRKDGVKAARERRARR